MRAPYQTLSFPYIKKSNGSYLYCIFKRKKEKFWQGLSGGGEERETPIETVKREGKEEANLPDDLKITQLSSMSSIPVEGVRGFLWGPDVPVIPEYTFGIEMKDKNIALSDEHSEHGWFPYKEAIQKLQWDSNKTALWELNYRLMSGLIK